MIIHNDFYFSIHILLGCSLLITIKNDMFDQSEGKLWNYCLVILTDGNKRVECTHFVGTVQWLHFPYFLLAQGFLDL